MRVGKGEGYIEKYSLIHMIGQFAKREGFKENIFIIDQQIARHVVQYSECLYNPPSLLYNSNS